MLQNSVTAKQGFGTAGYVAQAHKLRGLNDK